MPRQTPAPAASPRDRFENLIRTEARKAGVPPELALAVIEQESNFNPTARSPKGAIGLMQLMPATARQYKKDPTKPVENVQAGTLHLRYLLDKYNGDLSKTLAAYNAGEGPVDEAQGVPKFPETQAYVPGVLQKFATYVGQGAPSPPSPAPPPETARGGVGPGTLPPMTPVPSHARRASPLTLPPLAQVLPRLQGAPPGPRFAAYQPPIDVAATGPEERIGAPYQPPLTEEGTPDTGAPGALERGVRGAFQTGVKEPVQGLWEMGQRLTTPTPPIAGFGERFAGPIGMEAWNLAKGTVQMHWEEATKGYEAFQEGRYNDAIRHGAATAIPFVGPDMKRIIDEARQTGDYATATGKLTATVGPNFLKAFRLVKPVKPTGRVPKTYGERGGFGSSGALFWERLTERTIPGASVFQAFRQRQQQALEAMAEHTIQQMSPGRLLSPTETGAVVARGLEQTQAHVQDTLKALYGAIDEKVRTRTIRVPQTTDVPSRLVGPRGEPLTVPQRRMVKQEVGPAFASTRALKQAAIPILRRIRTEAKLIPPDELARSTRILEQIIRSPKNMAFGAFQDARSDLLRIVRSHGDLLPGKAAGVAKKLAAETDDAMIAAAENSGIPGLVDDVREANRFRAEAEVFNDTFIKKLIKDASPEKVSGMIGRATIDDIQRVRDLLPPQVWAQTQVRIMQDILDEATTGELARQMTGPQQALQVATQVVAGPAPPRLGAKDLERALERVGPEKLQVLFGRDGAAELVNIVNEAKSIAPKSAGMMHGLMVGGVNAAIIAPLLHPVATFMGVGPGTAAMVAGGFYGLAKLMTKPEGIRTYRRFAQAVSQGNRPLALTIGLQLTRQLQDQEQREPETGPPAPQPATAPPPSR